MYNYNLIDIPVDHVADEEASRPDELDEKMVEFIANEISQEKGEWARKILNVDPTQDLVLKPGLWLRYPKDPPNKFRVEIVRVDPLVCQVLCEEGRGIEAVLTKNLLRYRLTVPHDAHRPIPSWLKPGAHFLDPLATNVYARWVVRTINGGMLTAMCTDAGVFASWRTDELVTCQVRHIPTAWELLDDDLV